MSDAVKAHIVDATERIVILALGASFLYRFGAVVVERPHYLPLLLSQCMVIYFVLSRPWGANMTLRPYPVAIGFLGTMLPLLVSPIGENPQFFSLGGVVMFVGVLLSLSGVLTLNRRFGVVAANRGVQVRGPFALVRHPIYAGYTLTDVGFLMSNPAGWNFLVLGAALACQVLRIIEEEKFLSQDSGYRAYREGVKYRLVPGLF
jgi:protein-S-isoprenylcysteine O-methyltransferase Ste14